MDDSVRTALLEYIKRFIDSGTGKKESLVYLYKFVNALPAVESCEDAVSREWLLNELEEMNVANFYELNIHSKGAYEDMKRMLRDAPSVTVEPKTKVIAQVTFDEDKLREIVHEAVERIKEEYDIPKGEWIPCEERLPSEYRAYLTSSGKSVGLLYFGRCGWSGYGCGPDAWMPLPEPYMKGADE